MRCAEIQSAGDGGETATETVVLFAIGCFLCLSVRILHSHC